MDKILDWQNIEGIPYLQWLVICALEGYKSPYHAIYETRGLVAKDIFIINNEIVVIL